MNCQWHLFVALIIAGTVIDPTPAIGQVGHPTQSLEQPIDLADWLNRRLAEQLAKEGQDSVPVVDDTTFLRRVYLDLAGTIPSVSELRDFLADRSAYKRQRIVDQLLAQRRSAEHLAITWRRILIPGNGQAATMATQLDEWLGDQFENNVPYDELSRQLVTAGGAAARPDASSTSPTAYLLAAGGQPAAMASSVSRVFLGVQLGCAQCHDHPFADWTQEDFWGLAAFFAGARLRATPSDGELSDRRITQITPPEGGATYGLRYLWNPAEVEMASNQLPRQVFSEWLTSPNNPHFAATAVNRTWQYLCGRGLTDSVDDLDQATDAERELLDDLAILFRENEFNMRWLIQGICRSTYYQHPSGPDWEQATMVAARPLKVLAPEQLYNALEVSLALPISRIDEGPRYNGIRDQIVARMSEALGDAPEDFRGGIPQALLLMNGRLTTEATDLRKSRTLRGVIDAPFLNPQQKIETLFLGTVSRKPLDDELTRFLRLIESDPDDKHGQGYAALMWALINSPEFVLSR